MNWADDVSPLWQQAFELALQSHLAGSNPIGALVADSAGRVVSTGKSAVRAEIQDVAICHNEIAHAEVNALLGLDNREHGKRQAADYTLYATLEPCPVCFSAFYMSDVGTLRFAAKDAFGGSTNLLGTTPYLSRKQRKLVVHKQGDVQMTKKAILVIDMQKGLVLGAYREDELVATVNDLIARARVDGLPVIFVQHNHATFEPMMRGNRGWEIFGGLDHQSGDPVIEKEACDAFYETALESTLRGLGVEEVVVCGLQTEYCVDTACRSALSRNFDVTLVADAHSTGDSDMPAAEIVAHHNAVLANMVHPSAKIQVLGGAEVSFDV